MNPGASETVYVIVSGYGVLHCNELAMDCTKDDVLYVPSGHPHHFERLDGEIRIWRISLVSQPQDSEDALSSSSTESDATFTRPD
jgi:mannose-6-phosphate isomerase-like protein (cupin superfamily)